MANIRQLNQGASFWDFVNGFADPQGVFANQSFGHQPPPGFPPPQHHHHGGPPPNAARDAPPPPPQNEKGEASSSAAPADHTPEGSDTEQEPEHPRDEPRCRGHHGFGRGRGRGGHCGGRGAYPGAGFGFGRRGRGGPPPQWNFGEPWNRNMNNLGEFLRGFAPRDGQGPGAENNGDFVPPVDVFDTEAAYVVHVSLPGAKKDDTAVSWDPESSELSITGVVHRPGDEEMLKTLALDERKVGAFERKAKLGSRAAPAKVYVDGITAKLEDGVLRVEVPKEDKDFVEVKKVDVL